MLSTLVNNYECASPYDAGRIIIDSEERDVKTRIEDWPFAANIQKGMDF
jgi:hypothetical protein